MNIKDLHKITGEQIEKGRGHDEVAVNIQTFSEGPEGENIATVEKAEIVVVECRNYDDEQDSFNERFLVLTGDA